MELKKNNGGDAIVSTDVFAHVVVSHGDPGTNGVPTQRFEQTDQ